jgi:acetylornithine/succinyldiaminopimelate/putrescine aminotransferase
MMSTVHPLYETVDQIIQEQIPNFLRLYVNPFVAQTCLCLSRYVRDTWHAGESPGPCYQSFLANSFDEALAGAMKLARYRAGIEDGSKTGFIVDTEGRLGPLVSVPLEGADSVEFIPDMVVARDEGLAIAHVREGLDRFGFVVLFPGLNPTAGPVVDALSAFEGDSRPVVILCVDRTSLAYCRRDPSSPWKKLRPDIVVFDESFIRRHVPFGAFTARESLYRYWTRPGKTSFHSTTYQPNTVASLHFLRCLERDDPDYFALLSRQFDDVTQDHAYRKFVFSRLYNSTLARATEVVGWDRKEIQTAGHYITVNGKPIFDGVAGVACSIRGHNPAGYRQEIEKLTHISDYHEVAAERLRCLTGLGGLLPAVSGASAVENALRVGLVAQSPRKYVLALKGGFGGKTLLALTGTANDAYKTHIDPLYPHVVYVDPFGERATDDLEAAFQRYPVAVVQMELIQAVGGVRPVPEKVIRYLETNKRRWDYLLFVDEVQTGMYRTGPFLRSIGMGLEPDLVTVGKGTSDMMIPFAVTLYGDRVRERLEAAKSDLAEVLRKRFDYEFGYKTLLNAMDRAEEANIQDHVGEAGTLFAKLLGERLSACKSVHAIRVFGLLIAIELNTPGFPWRWLKKQAGSIYAMNLLRYEPFPVFVGYCQYEPHVLKLTPPLSITAEEIDRVCDALAAVLRRPARQLVLPFIGALARSYVKGRWERYRNGRANRERLDR